MLFRSVENRDEGKGAVDVEKPRGDLERLGLDAVEPLPEVERLSGHDRILSRVLADSVGVVRSGFVTLVGRPNVGKSTLLNAICGTKVTIVSDKPQTTRRQVRAVLTRPDVQVVFVDTPGLHKPVTALGERVNAAAIESLDEVDVSCLVIDATKPFGSGDRWVAERLDMSRTVVIVNKIDRVAKKEVVAQLAAAASLDATAYFAVSARTGEGVSRLVEHLAALLPEGPKFFPDDVVRELPEPEWVAELVREQLLAVKIGRAHG